MNNNFPHGGAMDTHFANMRSLIQVRFIVVFLYNEGLRTGRMCSPVLKGFRFLLLFQKLLQRARMKNTVRYIPPPPPVRGGGPPTPRLVSFKIEISRRRDRHTDRQTCLFGVLYNKWYIDHNFQINKNYKQQVIH